MKDNEYLTHEQAVQMAVDLFGMSEEDAENIILDAIETGKLKAHTIQ